MNQAGHQAQKQVGVTTGREMHGVNCKGQRVVKRPFTAQLQQLVCTTTSNVKSAGRRLRFDAVSDWATIRAKALSITKRSIQEQCEAGSTKLARKHQGMRDGQRPVRSKLWQRKPDKKKKDKSHDSEPATDKDSP